MLHELERQSGAVTLRALAVTLALSGEQLGPGVPRPRGV